tara:strand:- start:34663 stop:34860 length:198 start_codon:yes stop_codon:yes gene_type:complete
MPGTLGASQDGPWRGPHPCQSKARGGGRALLGRVFFYSFSQSAALYYPVLLAYAVIIRRLCACLE